MSTFNPVPKPPKDKKKQKKQNGWKDKPNRICFYTGSSGAERHEIYGGNPNRQISIDHGFQVDLCPEIHRAFHNPETEEDFERIEYWEKYYQNLYESRLLVTGVKPKQARDLWMLLIGENFMEPLEEVN